MTPNKCLLIAMIALVGCKDEEPIEPKHASCNALDKRGIISRLDNVRTDNQELFALNGQCLEASSSTYSGEVWGMRFIPATPEGETPDFHIQMYFLPPNEDQRLLVSTPDTLSRAQCVTVLEGEICGHVDDNSNDDAQDDVDLRGKSGTLDIRIVESEGDDRHRYEGDLEWALYGVDTTNIPEVYTEPSLRMWAEFNWAHPDVDW